MSEETVPKHALQVLLDLANGTLPAAVIASLTASILAQVPVVAGLKAQLVAVARVGANGAIAVGTDARNVSSSSTFGTGAYLVNLTTPVADTDEMVPNAFCLSGGNSAVAEWVDGGQIEVRTFTGAGVAANATFYILVWRIPPA